LRLGVPHDSDLAARWRAIDSRNLPDLVAYEGAAVWLIRRLRVAGAFDVLPPDIRDLLRQQAFEGAALRMEVEAEAAAVVAILDRVAVPVIFMKGVARCALAERYPYLDARATTDVDLLVPQAEIAAADVALRDDGYVPALPPNPAETRRHHHLPPLCKGGITVELHESTSIRVRPEVAWQRANEGSELVEWAGRVVRLPSATELAWSAVAHAMEDDVDGFRLKRFLEVAALVSGGAPIDWSVLAARSGTPESFDPAVGVRDQQAVVHRWISAALALVVAGKRPTGLDLPEFDLGELLAWRLAVFRAVPRTGRQFAGRLLAEGARAMTGFPLEGSPPKASSWGRIRRSMAARASRVAFHAWRARRRG
jgi:hypothetical protein